MESPQPMQCSKVFGATRMAGKQALNAWLAATGAEQPPVHPVTEDGAKNGERSPGKNDRVSHLRQEAIEKAKRPEREKSTH